MTVTTNIQGIYTYSGLNGYFFHVLITTGTFTLAWILPLLRILPQLIDRIPMNKFTKQGNRDRRPFTRSTMPEITKFILALH